MVPKWWNWSARQKRANRLPKLPISWNRMLFVAIWLEIRIYFMIISFIWNINNICCLGFVQYGLCFNFGRGWLVFAFLRHWNEQWSWCKFLKLILKNDVSKIIYNLRFWISVFINFQSFQRILAKLVSSDFVGQKFFDDHTNHPTVAYGLNDVIFMFPHFWCEPLNLAAKICSSSPENAKKVNDINIYMFFETSTFLFPFLRH